MASPSLAKIELANSVPPGVSMMCAVNITIFRDTPIGLVCAETPDRVLKKHPNQ
jgi:hypothetical protein